MIKKVFAKVKNVISNKRKISFLSGIASKKIIVIGATAAILIIVLGVGALVVHWKIEKYTKDNLSMARKGQITKYCPTSIQLDKGNQFVLPEDTAKSGEITIVVNDLDSAKNSVQNIATKNGGIVYNTFITYTPNDIKSGSIVVQTPITNFDVTFSDLKKIGSQVMQESSKQIHVRKPIVYPQPQPMAEIPGSPASADQNVNDSVIAPVPTVMPIYPQIVQDKGYIKVIFADYEKRSDVIAKTAIKTAVKTNIANMFGFENRGLNLRENVWVVLAIKSIVLIVLICIIVIIAKRIIINLQKINRNRKTVVKQITKNRKRVIKIAARKKKK